MPVSDSNATLTSLLIEPAIVSGGGVPQPLGTVSLASVAPEGGIEIALASNRPDIAQVPASVTIPQGTDATFFHVTIRPTNQAVPVVITASRESEARASTLQVNSMSLLGAVAAPGPNGAVPSMPQQAEAEPSPRPSGPTAAADSGPSLSSPTASSDSFRAALVAVLPALPVLAAIISAGVYMVPQGDVVATVLPWVKPNAVLVGSGTSLVVGLLFAAAYCWILGSTSSDRANSSAFGDLVARLRELEARVRVAKERTDLTPAERIACDQADGFCQLVRTELRTGGPRWIRGTGYVTVWNLIHRAEQALLLVEPVEDVLRSAIYDDLRLQGSQIDNSADLLVKLRLAITRLQPEAAGYFAQQAGTQTPDTSPPGDRLPATVAAARAALAQVHSSVDTFRDSNWGALARTRNHLMNTITVTGLGTYLMLAVALAVSGLAPTSPFSDAIVGASSFFLVGAMVGLFNRLNSESNSDNSIEDYGLTGARLALTPLLSGLAAVGGVLAVAMLPSVMSSGIFMVSNGAAASAQQLTAATPALSRIYSLQDNAFGVVFAGIFGLTPGLLLNSLQAAGDKYRASIQSTAPATQSSSS